jgi:hypothetical protein
MKFLNVGVLSCALSILSPSTAALGATPNHAAAELLTAPTNVSIMTPREGKSGFEQQLFDFGSAQNGFSELKRVFERQGCPTGQGICPNDAGACCPIGGRCCGGGKCCKAGYWCYSSLCCPVTQNGCDGQVNGVFFVSFAVNLTHCCSKGCCDKSAQCCKGGNCCASG